MIDYHALYEKKSFKDFIENIKYKINFNKENPDYFHADGLVCFTGPQGSGKTLSAVNYVTNLMEYYPNSKLVTNIMLKDYPIVTFDEFIQTNYLKIVNFNYDILSDFQKELIYNDYLNINRVFPFNNNDDLITYFNLDFGVIFFIDEIQLYFNSLESKNINMEVMTQISQQRKQRKHIIATSQMFSRMAKPLREQFSDVVQCRNLGGILQINRVINRDSAEIDSDSTGVKGRPNKLYWFFHSPKYYQRYDTYYLIDRNKFISNEERVGDIYDTRTNYINN